MISDSTAIKEEYEQWVKELEHSGGKLLSKHNVLNRKRGILKNKTFVYSAATLKQMLQEKKAGTWRPLNVAAERKNKSG